MTGEERALALSIKGDATKSSAGFGMESGFERIERVAQDIWIFTGEDGVATAMPLADAAEVIDNYFPED